MERYDLSTVKQRLALCVLAVAVLLTFGAARRRAIAPAPSGPVPTFTRDVARILQDNCQSCHHPGDIAPFSLMTYADAVRTPDAMKYMTRAEDAAVEAGDRLRRFRRARAS